MKILTMPRTDKSDLFHRIYGSIIGYSLSSPYTAIGLAKCIIFLEKVENPNIVWFNWYDPPILCNCHGQGQINVWGSDTWLPDMLYGNYYLKLYNSAGSQVGGDRRVSVWHPYFSLSRQDVQLGGPTSENQRHINHQIYNYPISTPFYSPGSFFTHKPPTIYGRAVYPIGLFSNWVQCVQPGSLVKLYATEHWTLGHDWNENELIAVTHTNALGYFSVNLEETQIPSMIKEKLINKISPWQGVAAFVFTNGLFISAGECPVFNSVTNSTLFDNMFPVIACGPLY